MRSKAPNHELRTDTWRRDLAYRIGWALAAKLAGLGMLWFFFFREGHS